jgi:hypothetical protein
MCFQEFWLGLPIPCWIPQQVYYSSIGSNLFVAQLLFNLGLFINFLRTINLIKLENKNLKRYQISISEQKYKKIMLQFYYFNHEDQEANKNWNNYEDFYQIFNDYYADKTFLFFLN